MRGRWYTAGLVVAVAVLVADTHRAHAEPPDPPGYIEAVERGLEEYNAQNFGEARAHFNRAHGISPNARTWRALGAIEFAVGNYPEAVRCFEHALASPVKPLDPTLRAELALQLTAARGYVDRVELRLDPSSATVWVDGVQSRAAASGVLLLGIGEHTLEFRAPDRITEQHKLHARGGATHTLSIELAPGLALASTDMRTDAGESSWYESPWFWAAVGVVVVGTVTGGVIAASRDGGRQREAALSGGDTGVILRAPRP